MTGLDHDWFTSYLDKRKQFSMTGGTSSGVEEINCGVPQGSCHGHPCSKLDLMSGIKNHVSMYADDTLSLKAIDDLQK